MSAKTQEFMLRASSVIYLKMIVLMMYSKIVDEICQGKTGMVKYSLGYLLYIIVEILYKKIVK